MSLLLTLSLLLSRKLSSELYTISSTSLSVRTFSPFAVPPVSLLSQQLNEMPWLKTCRANTSNYRTSVDSYIKWKAELFSAYLQKEMIHDIGVDLSQQQKWSPCSARVGDENISNYLTQYSIYESFSNSRRNLRPSATKIQRFLSVWVKQRELWELTFLTVALF